MKGYPKITRIQLYDQTKEEYTILGIVTSEADYKLSHLLNKKLNISLKNSKAIEVPGTNGSKILFSRYSDYSAAPEISYNLISNRSIKDFLLKKYKNIDFLFQINAADINFDIEKMTGTLRELERITAVFRLDTKGLKDKNLVYLNQ